MRSQGETMSMAPTILFVARNITQRQFIQSSSYRHRRRVAHDAKNCIFRCIFLQTYHRR